MTYKILKREDKILMFKQTFQGMYPLSHHLLNHLYHHHLYLNIYQHHPSYTFCCSSLCVVFGEEGAPSQGGIT